MFNIIFAGIQYLSFPKSPSCCFFFTKIYYLSIDNVRLPCYWKFNQSDDSGKTIIYYDENAFLVSQIICSQIIMKFFKRITPWFWINGQNILNFGLGCSYYLPCVSWGFQNVHVDHFNTYGNCTKSNLLFQFFCWPFKKAYSVSYLTCNL